MLENKNNVSKYEYCVCVCEGDFTIKGDYTV